MWTRHHKPRFYGRLIVPAITACFMSYFVYHSIHGDYGLIAAERFEAHKALNERKLERLVGEANAAKLLRLLPWQSDVLMEGRQTRNQTEEEQTAWVDALSVNRIRVVRIRFRNSVREHTIEW